MAGKVAAIVGGGSGMGAAAARRLKEDESDIAILAASGKGVALVSPRTAPPPGGTGASRAG